METNIPETIILLVGGRGTRLGELTKDCPKPLLPFRGKPFLAWKCEILANQGVKNFIFSTGYLSDAFNDFEEKWLPTGCTLTIITEDRPLGTGGALLNVLQNSAKIPDYFWAGNGDSFWNVDLMDQMHFILSQYNQKTITREMIDLCVKRIRPDQSGVILKEDQIIDWNATNASYINAGLYLFHKNFFAKTLRAESENELDTLSKMKSNSIETKKTDDKNIKNNTLISLESDLMPQKVRDNQVLGLIDKKNLFLDFGTPEFYKQVNPILDKYFN